MEFTILHLEKVCTVSRVSPYKPTSMMNNGKRSDLDYVLHGSFALLLSHIPCQREDVPCSMDRPLYHMCKKRIPCFGIAINVFTWIAINGVGIHD